MLALAGLLALVGAVTASVAAVAVARQRAAAVADLAALAAAGHAREGQVPACAWAARTAAADGGSLRVCVLDDDVVTVVAEVRPAGPLGRLGTARGSARAGPVAVRGVAPPHP